MRARLSGDRGMPCAVMTIVIAWGVHGFAGVWANLAGHPKASYTDRKQELHIACESKKLLLRKHSAIKRLEERQP